MRLVRVALPFAVWVVACSDGGSDLDRGTAPQIWCRGLCSAERRCRAVPAAARCEEACVADRPGLTNFSQDGARALRPCLENLSCTAFMLESEWNAELDACWDGARDSVDVSGSARAFCTAYVQAWFECGFFWSVSECERAYSMWADPVIDRFAPCAQAPSCDALRACDETTWSSL